MTHLKNIILIDDDEIIVYLTKRLVAETNLVSLNQVFSNGKDAIDYLKKNASNPDLLPEIIFLDLFMPIMNGWEFLDEYLKIESEINKQIKIYIISSSVSQEDIIRAKSYKIVSDYIIKPTTKEDFIAVLKKP